MPTTLKFCIDAGPSPWAAAQKSGDRNAMRAAVGQTIHYGEIADQAGIDSIWLLEDPDGWDAYAVLGAIARRTQYLRLGTGVTNTYYRHPAQIAASISTLDWLSDGRAFLGLGRGQTEWYEHALGMHVGSATKRIPEAISLLRQWWDDDMFAASPEDMHELNVQGWERVLRPIQGEVPIYFAAVGPIAMKIAAQHADGVIFNDLSSVEFMRDQIIHVKELATAAGRDPEKLTFNARTGITITDDPEAVYERRKATVATIHALPGMDRLLQNDRYDVNAIITKVREAMKVDEILARGGAFADLRREGDLEVAKAAIPTDLMADLVVAGDIASVRDQLRVLEDIGITHVFLRTPDDPESLPDIVKALQS